jgi:hypothetical protein
MIRRAYLGYDDSLRGCDGMKVTTAVDGERRADWLLKLILRDALTRGALDGDRLRATLDLESISAKGRSRKGHTQKCHGDFHKSVSKPAN